MNPVQKFPTQRITPISFKDVKFDPKRIPDLSKLFPTCSTSFSDKLADIKTKSVNASLTSIPANDNIEPMIVDGTTITFKPIDATIKALAAEWKAEIPKGASAYTQFKATYILGSQYDVILFVGKKSVLTTYLKSASSPTGHLWYGEATLSYCKKGSLYVFTTPGSIMFFDFDQ
jgi:hypothetical protein